MNLIILCFIYSSQFFSTGHNLLEKKIENPNIKIVNNYFVLINEAELSICKNDYAEASNNYKQAFKNLTSPFPKDIFNYIVLSIYEGNYSEAFNYSERLVKLGAELNFFDQVPLKNLKSDTLHWKKFCEDYPKFRKDYLQRINFLLKQELEELTQADQENYKYKSGKPSNSLTEDSICNRLFQIITEFGYPNHDLIGLNIKNDTILQPLIHEIILFHIFQTKNKNSHKVKDIIYDGVLNTKIEVEKAMMLLDYYYNYSFYGTRILYNIDNNLYIMFPDFELNNYDFNNLNRNKINAATIEEELQKVVYKRINSNSKFILNSLKYSNQIELDSMMKKFLIKIKLDEYKSNEFTKIFENRINLKRDFHNDSLQKYFELINYAELSICKKDYQNACDLYEDAFQYNLYPFPKDIYNCILVNIYQKEISSAINFCEELIKIGIEPKFFEQIPFKMLQGDNKLWTKFIKKISKTKMNFSPKIDMQLKNNMNDLIFNFASNFISNPDFSTIIDNKCYDQLIYILNTKGYPGHRLIGSQVYNDTIIDKPEGILSVYYQTHNELNELTSLLLKEIYSGNLHPSEFLNIVKNTYRQDVIFGTPIICKDIDNNYYVINIDDVIIAKKMEVYDQNRLNVLHNSINDELKKIIFKETNPNLKFNFYVSGIHQIENMEPYITTNAYKRIKIHDY